MSYTKWVETYGNAMSITTRRPAYYAKDITLRYVFRNLLDGDALNFTFDNFCGTEDITITGANVSVGELNGILNDDASIAEITFRGEKSVKIKAGGTVVSDDIDFEVKRGDNLVVTFYLGDYTQMRSSVVTTGPICKGYYAVGNKLNERRFDDNDYMSTTDNYFLSRVNVRTNENARCIICYGDSITAQDWPEYFSLALEEAGVKDVAVVRRAASGTRILRQYECITYESYGLKGDVRFPHESDACGADTIIIQQGINDIIHPVGLEVNKFRPMSDLPTVDQMADGIRYYIENSKKLGYKVFLGTLLPIEGWRTYAPFREELKEEFNGWLRSTDLSDGVVDFDMVVRDKENIKSFADGFDSGDHLHPSKPAYKAMGEEAFKIIFR